MTHELFTTHTLTIHEHIGFELGWDYARYRLTPPAPYAQEVSPLRHGLLAAQATFGSRALAPTSAVRKWLQLRLHAWLRGRSVELFQVTPHYLQQLDVSHCPITRVTLSNATLGSSDATIDRVRNDAGYAAGNLAVMSGKANLAKAAYGFGDAQMFVRQIETEQLGGIHGLTAEQWSRVATLCSFVEPLPHAQACALPLLILPPNRLKLFNPAQSLQTAICRQLLEPGWSHRVSRLENLLPSQATRYAFRAFFHTLLPRVLEACAATKQHPDPQRTRWAVEDAWRNPRVLERWVRFAQQLTPVQCETIVLKATARKLVRAEHAPDEHATEGWNLTSRGYVPHAVLMQRILPKTRPPAPQTAGQQTRLPL